MRRHRDSSRLLLAAATIALGTTLQPASLQAQAAECDRACLSGLVEQYLEAMLEFDGMQIPASIRSLPWAEQVSFTENDVGLMMGDGLWGSATAVGEGYVLPDPETGNVLWLGIVEEHGQPAYAALRLGNARTPRGARCRLLRFAADE